MNDALTAPPEIEVDTPQLKPFTFTGSGSEYFRIWIVNLALTLITLGIYSAWAKVRRMKYFYGNTVLDGSSFEYHGNPVVILKGRLVAVGLFVVYNLLIESGSALLAGLAIAGLAAALPVLFWKSLQFRARNSSWRGVRLGFGGSIGEAYKTFLLWPLLAIVTLYMLWPLAHHKIKSWQHSRTRFGQTPFAMSSCVGGFYKAYLVLLGAFVAVVAVAVAMAIFTRGEGLPGSRELAVVVGVAAFYILLFAAGGIMAAMLFNTVWRHTTLGPHRFFANIPIGKATFVAVTNLLGILFTLGLFFPWAAVRSARLRADHLSVLAAGSLEEFAAEAQQQSKALGEGVADLVDFDLGA